MSLLPSKWQDDGSLSLAHLAPHGRLVIVPNLQYTLRRRLTIAEINAGATLQAARIGYGFRLVEVEAVAVGGDVGDATSIDVGATQGGAPVTLVAFAQASLTRSAVLKDGATGAAVLADGASYVANDANTPLTIGVTGLDATGATHVDVTVTYAFVEA
ncbi:MAG: hypothetical protein R2745_03685 [Vicinamibacterales bacterium]